MPEYEYEWGVTAYLSALRYIGLKHGQGFYGQIILGKPLGITQHTELLIKMKFLKAWSSILYIHRLHGLCVVNYEVTVHVYFIQLCKNKKTTMTWFTAGQRKCIRRLERSYCTVREEWSK